MFSDRGGATGFAYRRNGGGYCADIWVGEYDWGRAGSMKRTGPGSRVLSFGGRSVLVRNFVRTAGEASRLGHPLAARFLCHPLAYHLEMSC